MPVKLKKIDETSIQNEHINWLTYYVNQMPTTSNKFKNELLKLLQALHDEQFSVLNYPKFWSGERLLETKIKLHIDVNHPAAYQKIKEWLKKQNQIFATEQETVQEIEKFKRNYDKYYIVLKRKALIANVRQLTKDLNHNLDFPNKEEENEALIFQFKTHINQVLSKHSLMSMQTRYDCLQAHLQVTLACRQAYELLTKNGLKEQEEEIRLIEVLTKRVIDSYYQNIKKMTFKDAVQKDISALTSTIAFFMGQITFILGIAAFFYPPLFIPVLILGLIGFISYLSSVITAIKIAQESFIYKRSPKLSEFVWLAVDIALLPLYVFAGDIVSLIGKSFNWAAATIKSIAEIWDNVLSNVFPDIFFAKDTFKEASEIGSYYTKAGQLKNTTATTWSLIRSSLTANTQADGVEIFEKISNTKKYLARQMGYRPKSSLMLRDELNQLLSEQVGQFKQKFPFNTSKNFQTIENSLNDYLQFQIKLKEQTQDNRLIDVAQYTEEIAQSTHYLYQISQLCEGYLNKHFDNKLTNQLSRREQAEIKRVFLFQRKARKLIKINHKDVEQFNESLLSKSFERYERGFAYTSLKYLKDKNRNNKEKILPIILSRHADILFWAQGFGVRGLRRSNEAKAVITAFNKYKALPADAERLETLQDLQEKCHNYLTKYQNENDKKKKGRYQYIKKLYYLIGEEINALNDNNLVAPILVGYKAR